MTSDDLATVCGLARVALSNMHLQGLAGGTMVRHTLALAQVEAELAERRAADKKAATAVPAPAAPVAKGKKVAIAGKAKAAARKK